MLYPTNIIIEKKEKGKIIKENFKDLKCKLKYLVFDRTNLWEKILVKLHI